jgi:hypothetical protein
MLYSLGQVENCLVELAQVGFNAAQQQAQSRVLKIRPQRLLGNGIRIRHIAAFKQDKGQQELDILVSGEFLRRFPGNRQSRR